MKAKNILMSVLLAMGFIAAKAAGYPPELALVSQPVMVYNYNSVTIYYDVENIGDYTYRGNVYIYLDPDNGYCYAEKYVKVRPGSIKRIAVEIPAYVPSPSYMYTIMPYYSLGDELYSFTTFEYFEPLTYYWNGLRNEPWVVIKVGPRVRYYHRPGTYRYYYDGFRPPMPPPGHGPATPPPPMNPKHHTYSYHHNNGGYPANHDWNKPEPKPNGNEPAPSATVRPNENGGSMSSGHYNSGNNGNNSNPPAPNNGGSNSSVKPKRPSGNGSNSGRTGNNSNVSRPNSNNRPNGSNSGRNGNSNVSRPKSNDRPSGNSNSGRSGNSNSSVNGSSSSRSNGTSSSSTRTGNSNSSNRSSSSSNNSRSSAGTRGR